VRGRLAAAALLAASIAWGAADAGAQSPDVLPNIVQAVPFEIGIQKSTVRGRVEWHLGFASATENRGAGPLRVRGRRSSRSDPTMTVDQLVTREDGSVRIVPDVGVMRYVVHSDHQHWHYLRFERYSLLPAGDSPRARRDRKTGFCLGDRYTASGGPQLPGFSPFPAHTSRCGLRKPHLLQMLEGISTGYGDNYDAHVEGQYIDITGLRAGRWELVQTANPTRALIETRYDDDSSSALLRITWPNGKRRAPRLQVLRRCAPGVSCAA
jgi:hypothetical protein